MISSTDIFDKLLDEERELMQKRVSAIAALKIHREETMKVMLETAERIRAIQHEQTLQMRILCGDHAKPEGWDTRWQARTKPLYFDSGLSMTFERGWRQRRAAAQARADKARNGSASSAYRIHSTRKREIDEVGRALVTLGERHSALVAEMDVIRRRIEVREYNAANALDQLAESTDMMMRLRARAAALPPMIEAAHAAVEMEQARVAAERAAIVARHAAEDAAHAAVAAQEARADAAATVAAEAVMAEVDIPKHVTGKAN